MTCTNTSGLAAGANKLFTVHVTLASTVNSGTVSANSASVTTGRHGSGRQQHEQHDDTTVNEDVHLTVTKTFDSPTVTAGGAPSRSRSP